MKSWKRPVFYRHGQANPDLCAYRKLGNPHCTHVPSAYIAKKGKRQTIRLGLCRYIHNPQDCPIMHQNAQKQARTGR